MSGAIAISQIYPELTSKMDKLKVIEPIAKSGLLGVGWATSGGESAAMLGEKYLAADGIENVIRVLEELEDDHIRDVDFIELNACSGGCVGGVLAIENPYVAQARIQNLRKYMPVSLNHLKDGDVERMMWENELEFNAESFRLSEDIIEAMDMMEKMEEICKTLPGLDCGSCGAHLPRPRRGYRQGQRQRKTDCIHKLKAKIQSVYDQLGTL